MNERIDPRQLYQNICAVAQNGDYEQLKQYLAEIDAINPRVRDEFDRFITDSNDDDRTLSQRFFASMDDGGWPPLFHAVMSENLQCVELLIKHVDVNTQHLVDGSALHLAALIGNVECLNMLIQNAADIHASTRRNARPLDVALFLFFSSEQASQQKYADCINQLLAVGAGMGTTLPQRLIGYLSSGRCRSPNELLPLLINSEIQQIQTQNNAPHVSRKVPVDSVVSPEFAIVSMNQLEQCIDQFDTDILILLMININPANSPGATNFLSYLQRTSTVRNYLFETLKTRFAALTLTNNLITLRTLWPLIERFLEHLRVNKDSRSERQPLMNAFSKAPAFPVLSAVTYIIHNPGVDLDELKENQTLPQESINILETVLPMCRYGIWRPPESANGPHGTDKQSNLSLER